MQLLKHFKELSIYPKNAKELKGLVLELALRGTITKDFRKGTTIAVEDKIEGYYDLPSNWYWDKFDNICDFQMGKTPPSKEMEYWGGDIPWISIADMETYGYITTTKKTINDLSLRNYFKNTIVKKGTLIMSFKLTIGKTSILNTDACHNEAIISIYPKQEVLKEYLFRFLPIISNWGSQVSALMGNTLNKGKIQNLRVPIPPLAEQHAIVETVNTLFKEVEALEKLTLERVQLKEDFITSALRELSTGDTQKEWSFLQKHFSTFMNEESNIKKLRETVLQLAVQGKLTATWRADHSELISGSHSAKALLEGIKAEKAQLIKDKKIKKEKPLPAISEDEIPYELPEGWEWCRVGDVVRFMAYGTSEKTNDNYTLVPVLRMGNITTDGRLLYSNLKYISSTCKDLPKAYLEHGDLVFNRTNSYELVGKSAVFKGDENSYTLASYLIKVSPFIDFVSSDYLNNYIISKVCRSTQIEPQITAQTNQANFSGSKLKSIMLPLPPLAEQKAIVEKVNSLMALCDELEKQVIVSKANAEMLMQSVLREVFQGKAEPKPYPVIEEEIVIANEA